MTADGPARGGRRWTRGEGTVVAAGALLVVNLLVAPWHHFAIDVSGLEQFGVELPAFSLDRRGVQNPQAFFGVASAAVATLMVIQIVAAKLSPGIPRLEEVHLVAGPVVLGLIVAKLMANNDFLGPGAWLGALLAVALAYGGFVLSQENSGSGPDRPRRRSLHEPPGTA